MTTHRWRVLGQCVDVCRRCSIERRVIKRWSVVEYRKPGAAWVPTLRTPPCPGA